MIRTLGLQARHGANPPMAFADVDWPQGTLALLTGVSGSGKSTWLALVAALKAPSSGSLCVAGRDITGLRGAQADAFRAQHVALLPQRLLLNDALSVADNLGLAQWARGVSPKASRVQDALARVGVAELAERPAAHLSGGQAQRVALARALLGQPQVILADEPTASLDDANASAAVQALLDVQRASAATLVIATHDPRVAHMLGHRALPPSQLALA